MDEMSFYVNMVNNIIFFNIIIEKRGTGIAVVYSQSLMSKTLSK